MKNLELDDPRPFLPFERRVEYFAAAQAVQVKNPREARVFLHPEGSQEAQRDTQPNMAEVDSMADEAKLAVLSDVTDLLGPNDEYWGEKQLPLGGRSRSRKRSASKRTRRKASAKKQKSKKNKRQSRRKVRRSSSRKSRK